MPDEKDLVELIERAYVEHKARYIRKNELLAWLKRNGLTSDEVNRVIGLGMKRRIIRFCYPSSIGGKELVPCYEKLAVEERELPLELKEALMKRASRKDSKMLRIKAKGKSVQSAR